MLNLLIGLLTIGVFWKIWVLCFVCFMFGVLKRDISLTNIFFTLLLIILFIEFYLKKRELFVFVLPTIFVLPI